MKTIVLVVLLMEAAVGRGGVVPTHEVSLGGINVGDSRSQVETRLGEPVSTYEELDYLDTHYSYPDIRVSFSMDVVAGLYTQSPRSCTPAQLCPGDSFAKMWGLYGEPVIADRETGRFYEYYGVDLYCWLQIPAGFDKIHSISVACQP